MDLLSDGLAINYKDSARPFVSWTHGNVYFNCILVDSQYVLNVWDLKSHALYKHMEWIGWSKNLA